MGVNADEGKSAQGGLAFGRAAWVGLSGDFGSVQIGRQNKPIFDAVDASIHSAPVSSVVTQVLPLLQLVWVTWFSQPTHVSTTRSTTLLTTCPASRLPFSTVLVSKLVM
jgi:hypothetical protein